MLQNSLVLSAASFSKLTASHPWSSRRPGDVLLELQRTILVLTYILSELNPGRQRERAAFWNWSSDGAGSYFNGTVASSRQRRVFL
jgi:hypothetical protein